MFQQLIDQWQQDITSAYAFHNNALAKLFECNTALYIDSAQLACTFGQRSLSTQNFDELNTAGKEYLGSLGEKLEQAAQTNITITNALGLELLKLATAPLVQMPQGDNVNTASATASEKPDTNTKACDPVDTAKPAVKKAPSRSRSRVKR